MNKLTFLDAKYPDIAARRGDNSLHQPELAIEGYSLWGRQRLAVLVEHRNRSAAISGEPSVVLGIDSRTKGAPFHPTAGEADRIRLKRVTVRCELGCMAFP